MAVPVRADLMAQTLDFGKRTMACMNRVLREANLAVTGLARGLGDPLRLIEERQQRLDVSGERLALATRQLVERRGHALAAARLISPVAVLLAKQQALVAESRVLEGAMRRYVGDTRQKIERTTDRIEQYGERLRRCGTEFLAHGLRQVDQLGKLLESYSFHSVLNRGFALVRDQDGHPIMTAAETHAGDTIAIEFADGRIGAKVTEGAAAAPRAAAPPRRRDGGSGNQGSLL
jgi:exodeoxyribonuclease VII large subunit